MKEKKRGNKKEEESCVPEISEEEKNGLWILNIFVDGYMFNINKLLLLILK